jgi:hypothetical protein
MRCVVAVAVVTVVPVVFGRSAETCGRPRYDNYGMAGSLRVQLLKAGRKVQKAGPISELECPA